jgi:hypothetical protein
VLLTLESTVRSVNYVPDHIFSSAMVALFAALLPYVEHLLQPTWTWESVEWEDGDAVRAFREQRRKLVEGSDKVRRRLAKEESERTLGVGKRARATFTIAAVSNSSSNSNHNIKRSSSTSSSSTKNNNTKSSSTSSGGSGGDGGGGGGGGDDNINSTSTSRGAPEQG